MKRTVSIVAFRDVAHLDPAIGDMLMGSKRAEPAKGVIWTHIPGAATIEVEKDSVPVGFIPIDALASARYAVPEGKPTEQQQLDGSRLADLFKWNATPDRFRGMSFPPTGTPPVLRTQDSEELQRAWKEAWDAHLDRSRAPEASAQMQGHKAQFALVDEVKDFEATPAAQAILDTAKDGLTSATLAVETQPDGATQIRTLTEAAEAETTPAERKLTKAERKALAKAARSDK